MKFLMIFLSVIMSVVSSSVFAHTDHALGEGSLHVVYHITFWFIVFAVIYKAICWFRAKKKAKH